MHQKIWGLLKLALFLIFGYSQLFFICLQLHLLFWLFEGKIINVDWVSLESLSLTVLPSLCPVFQLGNRECKLCCHQAMFSMEKNEESLLCSCRPFMLVDALTIPFSVFPMANFTFFQPNVKPGWNLISNWLQDIKVCLCPLLNLPWKIEILMKLLDSGFLQRTAKSQCHLLWLLSNKIHCFQQVYVSTWNAM